MILTAESFDVGVPFPVKAQNHGKTNCVFLDKLGAKGGAMSRRIEGADGTSGGIEGADGTSRGIEGAGGTSGGIGEFLLGLFLTFASAYMLTNNIQVSSGFWSLSYGFFGGMRITAFGVTLIPLCLGFFWLFFDGESKIGWLLTIGSITAILIGVLMTLHVHFRTTSLYVFVMMIGMLMGGLGLLARSLKPH